MRHPHAGRDLPLGQPGLFPRSDQALQKHVVGLLEGGRPRLAGFACFQGLALRHTFQCREELTNPLIRATLDTLYYPKSCEEIALKRAVIECPELTDKIIRELRIHDDPPCGREVHIEFTDGTEFTVALISTTTVDAKYYRDRGGELEVLREFRDSSIPRL